MNALKLLILIVIFNEKLILILKKMIEKAFFEGIIPIF